MSVLGSRSETSFKKQCHKGLTEVVVVQPEKVAARSGANLHLLIHHSLARVAKADCQLQCRFPNDFWELVNALYLALTFGAYQPML